MAVWYEVEKTPKGIHDFLSCNWEFHDFRIEWVRFVAAKDMVEIFLKYDTGDMGVLLRFAWICDFHVGADRDYDVDWLGGSVLIPIKKGRKIIWIDTDTWGNKSKDHIDELKEFATWVEAEKLFWAMTDGDGSPIEMPADHIDQVWECYGRRVEKHFELKGYHGKWTKP